MTQDLCRQVLKDSGGEDSKKCFAERMSTVHRLKVLVNSFRRLVLKLQDFVAYQDVLAPYISGLIQVRIPSSARFLFIDILARFAPRRSGLKTTQKITYNRGSVGFA